MEEKIQFQKDRTKFMGNILWREYRDGMADGTLTPERAERLRKHFVKQAARHRECGAPDLPPSDSPAQSDQIRPNPTCEIPFERIRHAPTLLSSKRMPLMKVCF